MSALKKALLPLAALTLLCTAGAVAESSRHVRHDGSSRILTILDPSGQLLVEWRYEGDHGDFVRDDGDGDWFMRLGDRDAHITVFANVGGRFVPVGEGRGKLSLTSTAVRSGEDSWSTTDRRFNLKSHGEVETFAGTWDFRVGVVLRDGAFQQLSVSEPPF